MKRLFLEDRLLDRAWHSASAIVKPYNELIDKIGASSLEKSSHCTLSDLTRLKKSIHSYISIYYSIAYAAKQAAVLTFDADIQRAIYCYFASIAAMHAVGSLINSNHEIKVSPSTTLCQKINFNGDNSQVIDDSIKLLGIDDEISLGQLLKRKTKLEQVTNCAYNYILSSEIHHSEDETIHYKLEDFTIHSRDFIVTFSDPSIHKSTSKISQLNRSQNQNQENQANPQLSFSETPEICNRDVKKVIHSDIVGNQVAKNCLLNAVHSLFFYDPIEKRNPFQGFPQYILLCGKPGTGKTMLANYAISLGNEISSESRKDLKVSRLEFEDRWQCGPIENLRNQFRTISDPASLHMVLIDELETKFGSRESISDDYRKDVIGEFLRFRGEGTYNNLGNYLFLATANQPRLIDKSLLDVFTVLEIEGPKTITERLLLLKKELGYEKASSFIKVEDWDEISIAMQENELSGREIHNVACMAFEKYRQLSVNLEKGLIKSKASEVEIRIKDILKHNPRQFCTYKEDILASIGSIATKRGFQRQDYLT